LALQRRWNSNAAPREPVPENAAENAAGEAENKTSPVSADESDARVLESAIQAAAEASPAVVNEVSESAEAAAASEQETEELGKPTRRPSFVTPPDPKETVYIGNLFFDVTAEDLKQQMSKYGTVEFCKIIHDSRGLSKG
jgi:nucleolin